MPTSKRGYCTIIAYLIWKGSYNSICTQEAIDGIIAYLIWKGSYNLKVNLYPQPQIIAYLIWKGSYNSFKRICKFLENYSISDLERKL